MTLRLILVRHAKSDWQDPLDSDHERGLAPRGQDAAPRVGKWLAQNGYLPLQALVSDARRTRQTWALISGELPDPPMPEFDPVLYHASADTMLRALRNARAQTVLMLGHNPGIGSFASLLLSARPDHPQIGRYPTCATLVADFDLCAWSEIGFGTGRAVDFVVPAELG